MSEGSVSALPQVDNPNQTDLTKEWFGIVLQGGDVVVHGTAR